MRVCDICRSDVFGTVTMDPLERDSGGKTMIKELCRQHYEEIMDRIRTWKSFVS